MVETIAKLFQNSILAAKINAAFNWEFSPDKEDVQAVATGILSHKIVKNYKGDAEGITVEKDNCFVV